MRTFFAVLAALLVFGVVVVGYQAVAGPSEAECSEQELASVTSGGVLEVDPAC